MPPRKVNITDAMRAAVRAEMCATEGHTPDLTGLFESSKTPGQSGITIGESDGVLPHLSCSRCSAVWILVPDPGTDLGDAKQKFKDRLKDDDPLKKDDK